jgi:hypothetical protein
MGQRIGTLVTGPWPNSQPNRQKTGPNWALWRPPPARSYAHTSSMQSRALHLVVTCPCIDGESPGAFPSTHARPSLSLSLSLSVSSPSLWRLHVLGAAASAMDGQQGSLPLPTLTALWLLSPSYNPSDLTLTCHASSTFLTPLEPCPHRCRWQSCH